MLKKVLMILFVLVGLSMITVAYAKEAYVVEKTTVYNTSKKKVGTYSVGTKVNVVAKKGNWCLLKNGKVVSAKHISTNPIKYYASKYGDIVFVSIKRQKVVYYKNGKIVAKGKCVTGHAGKTPTPKGLFTIIDKVPNTDLMGGAHVDYFCKFTSGGIGLHDADRWRTHYGGKIYKTKGSHGCVNLPLSVAKAIYINSTEGKTKVLVF